MNVHGMDNAPCKYAPRLLPCTVYRKYLWHLALPVCLPLICLKVHMTKWTVCSS